MKTYTENEHRYALRKANKIRSINLLGKKCIKCGEKNIHVLEFHHDNKEKENSISQILDSRWSLLKKEVSKCVLLCCNCHAEFHCNNARKRSRRKKRILLILGIFKCQKCGYRGNNPASLDFHHLNDKTKKFSISKNIMELKIQEIMEETNKCKILCKNCHHMEHFDLNKFNEMKELIDYKIDHHKEKTMPLNKISIWKMYNSGIPQKNIAKHFGVGSGTISHIISLIKENSRKYL